MRPHPRLLLVSGLAVACQGPGTGGSADTVQLPPPADSPATVSSERAPRPVESRSGLAAGKEPGTFPATPTPTVTSESAIAAIRLQLQRIDTASIQTLQGMTREYATNLGDLLTTMRVEVQAVTSPTKNSWIAAADTVENDLAQLTSASGEALRTAFREHRARVARLLDAFRMLVPARTM